MPERLAASFDRLVQRVHRDRVILTRPMWLDTLLLCLATAGLVAFVPI